LLRADAGSPRDKGQVVGWWNQLTFTPFTFICHFHDAAITLPPFADSLMPSAAALRHAPSMLRLLLAMLMPLFSLTLIIDAAATPPLFDCHLRLLPFIYTPDIADTPAPTILMSRLPD